MSDPLATWWCHDITLARLAGSGPYGEVYADPVIVTGWIDDRRRLVRDEVGTEVISETTIRLPITTPDVPLGSSITLPAAFGSRQSQVLSASRHDGAGLPVPSHLELALA